tara:strand:+ start:2430 stop:3854 length:1425 start_codon:yes stop_codon:yes gene_type:complete
MQGIASLPYEVVEQPMIPLTGIGSMPKQAEILADFGRNGDTYIVHAAEGETVVPMEVFNKNPRLKSMLWQQMAEMGIEPERYIVGNELNSINPVTGQPEFFLKKIFKGIKAVTKAVLPYVAATVGFSLGGLPGAFVAGTGTAKLMGQSWEGAAITGGLSAFGANYLQGSEAALLGSTGTNAGTRFLPKALIQGVQKGGITSLFSKAGGGFALGQLSGKGAAAFTAAAPTSGSLVYGPAAGEGLAGTVVGPGGEVIGTAFNPVTGQMTAPGGEVVSALGGGAGTGSGFAGDLITKGKDWYKGLSFPGQIATLAAVPTVALAATKSPATLEEPPITGTQLLEENPEKYGLNIARFTSPYDKTYNEGGSKLGKVGDITGQKSGIVATQQNIIGYDENGNPIYGNAVQRPNQMQVLSADSGGEIVGPGTGTSDSIPALLSDGEFVMTAKAVKNAGNGNRRAGAQKMYSMMKNLERGAA